MNVYILIFILCLCFSMLELAVPKSNKKYKLAHLFFFLVISGILFLIAGFRECGFDYMNYWIYFDQISGPDWFADGLAIGSEPGYSFLNHVLGNYAAVIAVMSALILWLQFKFVYKYSFLPFLAIIFYLGLFFYPSTMGQFRQALAMAIILWAISSIENKVKFLLLIALAMMFHFSAILGLLALFIPRTLKSTKFYVWSFVAALLISISAQTVYLNFISSLPPYIAVKLAHYASIESTPLGLNSAVLIRAFVFGSCYYFKDKLLAIPHMSYFINIYFLSLLIYTALGFAPQVGGRGSIYFSFFEIILISNLIFVLTDWKRILFFITFVGFSIYRQLQFFDQWTDDYIPLKNWLFNLFN